VLLPPLPVKSGVVVFGVVRNDHHASSASGAGRLQVPEKLPARKGVVSVSRRKHNLPSRKRTAPKYPTLRRVG
jgi:hypothetical protein